MDGDKSNLIEDPDENGKSLNTSSISNSHDHSEENEIEKADGVAVKAQLENAKKINENMIRTELQKRKIPNNKIDCTIEIIREIVSQSTLFGQPIIYHDDGMAYIRKNQNIPLTLQVYQDGEVYIHFKSEAKQTKDVIAEACQKRVYRTINAIGTTFAASVIRERDPKNNITTFNTEMTAHNLFKGCRYILQSFAASSYDAKNSNNQKYTLITECCDGVTDQRFFDQLSLKERWEFFLHILEGVQEMHEKGYSHFDLKSDNILYKKVNDSYEPRIIDFGVMLQMDEKTRGARGAFLPPEYLVHENYPIQVTETVDVWAMGQYAIRNLLNLSPDLDMDFDLVGDTYIKKYKLVRAYWEKATPGSEGFIPIIQQMLKDDPKNRISLASAIAQIKNQINVM